MGRDVFLLPISNINNIHVRNLICLISFYKMFHSLQDNKEPISTSSNGIEHKIKCFKIELGIHNHF